MARTPKLEMGWVFTGVCQDVPWRTASTQASAEKTVSPPFEIAMGPGTEWPCVAKISERVE
jgi:hypothetical protein